MKKIARLKPFFACLALVVVGSLLCSSVGGQPAEPSPVGQTTIYQQAKDNLVMERSAALMAPTIHEYEVMLGLSQDLKIHMITKSIQDPDTAKVIRKELTEAFSPDFAGDRLAACVAILAKLPEEARHHEASLLKTCLRTDEINSTLKRYYELHKQIHSRSMAAVSGRR